MQDRAEALGPLERHLQGANMLAYAGVLALAQEVMKSQVIDAVKRYYGRIGKEWTVPGGESRYTRECLNLVPDNEEGRVWKAHTAWFVAQGALTQEQVDDLGVLKNQRDDVVHELASHLMIEDRNPDREGISKAIEAFFALDKFWRQKALEAGWVEPGDLEPGEELTLDTVQSNAGTVVKFALRSLNITFGRQGVLADWLQNRNLGTEWWEREQE